ncbi:MAG: hypothetical protein ND895_09620 [Pyrinomonadaceae bacterium]|nr:hypothetical protein [Pyrinomonadaceae bacterium]
MRFEFYHAGLDDVPKLSVDGTVSNSIHFSHWEGNQTPEEVKADTSTEIALNLVGSPNQLKLTQGIELVTNNHFDTDGVLSVWTVLKGERALDLREQLIPAAEAGDFSEFSSVNGVRASIVIQGSDQASPNNESGSPLAAFLGGKEISDDAEAYDLVLPEVERVLRNTGEYETLWLSGWEAIAGAIESFEKGQSKVEEYPDALLSLITLAPEVFSPSGFDPTRHAAPFTAISRYAHGQLFLIATAFRNGWMYRIDYPYYSWAETVVRPRVKRHDFGALISQLNQIEQNNNGRWKLDNSEMTSAVKFLDVSNSLAASKLRPDELVSLMRAELLSRNAAGVA